MATRAIPDTTVATMIRVVLDCESLEVDLEAESPKLLLPLVTIGKSQSLFKCPEVYMIPSRFVSHLRKAVLSEGREFLTVK